MFERVKCEIWYPSMMDGPVRLRRAHTRMIKESLKEEMLAHQQKRLPRHFMASARGRYKYYARKKGYKWVKMKTGHGRTDLVYSRRTEWTMTRSYRSLSVSGGTSSNSVITVNWRNRFPFPVSADPKVSVTPHKMAEEIETFDQTDLQEVTNGVRDRYTEKLNVELQKRSRKVSYSIKYSP